MRDNVFTLGSLFRHRAGIRGGSVQSVEKVKVLFLRRIQDQSYSFSIPYIEAGGIKKAKRLRSRDRLRLKLVRKIGRKYALKNL